jgi:TatD DNase family protein
MRRNMLFDTHAHYNDEQFDKDRRESLIRAYESGVGYILSASSDIASSIENISLTQEFDFVYASVGVHPHQVLDINNNIISALADFASYPKVVAIGEIGLDYYYENSPREAQKIWFAKQISLAVNLGLPVIVHDRDAHEDTLDILKRENARKVGGVLHCFSGSVEMAKELLDNNFYISIGGPVTFKNAKKSIEVVKYIPEDRLLIETDSPYLTPEPLRGSRNESTNVRLVAERIANIRGKSVEYIETVTTENAKRLFCIS